MSSRTENDDPWLRLPLRTAECGPRRMLPAYCVGRKAGMMGRLQSGGRPDPGLANIAKFLPVSFSLFLIVIFVSLLLVLADIVNPVNIVG